MKKSELALYLSEGNMKLARNDKEYFLIWNLPAVTTCPNRTAMCEKACYARKAERLYPQVLPCRENNFDLSRKSSFTYDMIHTIRYYLGLKKNIGKKCYFRIHESGDFYNQNYTNAWIYIASQLPEVTFLAYTKSIQFFTNGINETVPQNMTIRYSIWDDTNKRDIEIANDLQLPIYTAFPKEELLTQILTTAFIECDCDCSKCKMCYNKEYKKIAVAIH